MIGLQNGNGTRRYEASPLWRWVALAGIALFSYPILYTTGIIGWSLFPSADDWWLREAHGRWATLTLSAIFMLVGCTLLWESFTWVEITHESITYAGPRRRVTIRWADVSAYRVHPRYGDIVIRSATVRIRLDCRFVRFQTLKADIVHHIGLARQARDSEGPQGGSTGADEAGDVRP